MEPLFFLKIDGMRLQAPTIFRFRKFAEKICYACDQIIIVIIIIMLYIKREGAMHPVVALSPKSLPKGMIMDLKSYFADNEGFGVLSTADSRGKVDAAIYARPHFINEDTIAFIAGDRLTHANLQSNSSAVFLFKEKASFEGKRLYLTRIREEKDSPLIDEIRRKKRHDEADKTTTESKFLIYFKIDSVRPLIGDGK
jgi:hypothetical protein